MGWRKPRFAGLQTRSFLAQRQKATKQIYSMRSKGAREEEKDEDMQKRRGAVGEIIDALRSDGKSQGK